MSKFSSLEMKLAAYSTFSAALLMADKSSAQIVYTDLVPDVVIDPSNNTYYLDLNNDDTVDFQIFDFKFWYHNTDSSGNTSTYIIGNVYAQRFPLNNTNVHVAGDSVHNNATPFAEGEVIDSNLNWNHAGNLYFFENHSIGPTITSGYWIPPITSYLGLRVEVNGVNYYGWVRLQISYTSTLKTTVMDYAYNSIPDSPIVISEIIPTAATAPTDKEITASIYNHSLTIQIDPVLIGGDLFLYDVYGNLKKKVTVENTTITSDVKSLPDGIYILQIRKDGREWVKKILIQ